MQSSCNRTLVLISSLFIGHNLVKAQQENDFIELDILHFGEISRDIGSTCTMGVDGNITGDCDASSPNLTLGRVLIENLPKNSEFFLTVSGSSSTELTFLASGQIIAASATTPFSDNEQIQIRSRGNNNTAELIVGGEISVEQTLANGQSYNTSYTISIDIQ